MQAFAAGDMNAARHFLDEALKLDPQNPEILNGLCAVTYRLGDFELAVRYVHAAVEKAPNTWKFWDQYISIVMVSGDNRRAAAICEEASKHVFGSVDLLNYWGRCCIEIEDFELALEKLTAATEIAPDNITVLRNLSLAQLKLDRLEDSVKTYSRSTQALDQDATRNEEALCAQYADLASDYDANALHVTTVNSMHALLLTAFDDAERTKLKVLDCGCGTGMLGEKIGRSVE